MFKHKLVMKCAAVTCAIALWLTCNSVDAQDIAYLSEGCTTITHDPDVSDNIVPVLNNTGTLGSLQYGNTGVLFTGLPQLGNPPLQADTTHILDVGGQLANTQGTGGIGYNILTGPSQEAAVTFRASGGLTQDDPIDLYGGASSQRYDFDITFVTTTDIFNLSADLRVRLSGNIPVSGMTRATWEFNYSDPLSGGVPYIVGVDYQDINGVISTNPAAVPGAITGEFLRNLPGNFSQNVLVNDLFVLPMGFLLPNSEIRINGFFEFEAENNGSGVEIDFDSFSEHQAAIIIGMRTSPDPNGAQAYGAPHASAGGSFP